MGGVCGSYWRIAIEMRFLAFCGYFGFAEWYFTGDMICMLSYGIELREIASETESSGQQRERHDKRFLKICFKTVRKTRNQKCLKAGGVELSSGQLLGFEASDFPLPQFSHDRRHSIGSVLVKALDRIQFHIATARPSSQRARPSWLRER